MSVLINPFTGTLSGGLFRMGGDGQLIELTADEAESVFQPLRTNEAPPLPDSPAPTWVPEPAPEEEAGDAPLAMIPPGDPGPWRGRCTPKTWSYYELQWEGYETRRDMSKVLSAWLRGPGEVGISETKTVSWRCELSVDLGLLKDAANIGLKYERSEMRTEASHHTKPVPAGKYGRMVFYPKMLHKNGWLTVQAIKASCEKVTIHQRVWCPIYIPVPRDGSEFPAGVYDVQLSDTPF
jgi:hypothetical protein